MKKIGILFFSIGLFFVGFHCVSAEGIAPVNVVDTFFADDSSQWPSQTNIYRVDSVIYWLENSTDWQQYGSYYVCQISTSQTLQYCYFFNDYTQLTYDSQYGYFSIAPNMQNVRVRSGANATTYPSIDYNNLNTNQMIWYSYSIPANARLYTNLKTYLKTGSMGPTYQLAFTQSISDVGNIFIESTNLNTNAGNIFSFKWEYLPTSLQDPVYPVWSIKFYSQQYGEAGYIEDSGDSGFTYSCEISNGIQICEGQIVVDDVSSAYTGSYLYKWFIVPTNYEALDGTINAYRTSNSSTQYTFTYTESFFRNMTRYAVHSLDFLVSPNGTYDLYYQGIENIAIETWVLEPWIYNIELDYFRNRLTWEDVEIDTVKKYKKLHVSLVGNEYLRFITPKVTGGSLQGAWVFYGPSGLHFESVINDEVVIYDSQGNSTSTGVENSDVVSSDGGSGFISFFGNAFKHFKNIFIFIFDVINEFYNFLPLSFKYYIAFAFLLLIVFIMRNFV